MTGLLLFLAGLAVGIIATVTAGVVIINRPLPERERPPVSYSAICAGCARSPEDLFEAIDRCLR
jgi:hypothetical protein